ncbi:hypothetical protein ACES2L_00705 [Bdellovibrio bacteriovorus]
MNKYNLACVLLLWSCISLASVTSTLVPVDRTYSNSYEEMKIDNMPRVRSQDSLGVCFGFSSATVAQFYRCKTKNITCSPLPENKEISPIAMVAWSNPNNEKVRGGTFSDHSNIRFGGKGYGALGYLAEQDSSAVPESCYPFDQFANKYGGDESATNALIKKLQVEYDKNKKTEGSACEECLLQTMQKEFGAKTSLEDVASALKEETFAEYLYSLFFRSCGDKLLSFQPAPLMGYFPKGTTATYNQVIDQTKNILKQGYPLVLDGICPFYKDGVCTGGHSVVISGYRKVCKPDNTCRDVLKIQNSWGEDWQKQNDDGWLDAKILLGDKPLKEGTISWWLPKN